MSRNIYLISQIEHGGYDVYTSAVVVAASEAEARLIHPGARTLGKDWKLDWASTPSKVKVKWVGFTNENFDLGTVLCASFNAG